MLRYAHDGPASVSQYTATPRTFLPFKQILTALWKTIMLQLLASLVPQTQTNHTVVEIIQRFLNISIEKVQASLDDENTFEILHLKCKCLPSRAAVNGTRLFVKSCMNESHY